VPPSKRRVSHEKQKLYQSLVDFSGKFNSFYNLPDLDVIVEEREGAAYSRPFMPGERAKILIPVNYYNAVRKSKQKRFHRQLFASFGHEEGHHLQYAYGGGDDVVPRGDSDVVNMFKGSEWTGAREDSVSKSRATAENFAWNALQRFVELKTPRQLPKMKGAAKLRRNWAFGTYTKHTPSIMSGADKKITYDWRTNLLVRPHEAGSDFFSSPKVRITGISSEARLRKKRKSR
jgi:hypothetical protein